jgi:hypothetical protein
MKQLLRLQRLIVPILSNWGRTLSASAEIGAHSLLLPCGDVISPLLVSFT